MAEEDDIFPDFEPDFAMPIQSADRRSPKKHLRREAGGRRKRRGGGQPGNQNVRKHGLYAELAPRRRRRRHLMPKPVIDIYDEIEIAHINFCNVLADPDASIDALIRSCDRLARLLSKAHGIEYEA